MDIEPKISTPLVDEVRSARTLDDYADTAMHGLAELIECQDVSYNEMDPVGQRVNWKVTPDHGPLLEEFAPTFARLMRQNPLIRHFEETGDTRALMWTDLVTTEEMRQTELYQEMFKHLGVDHQMALTLPAPHGIVIGFAVNSPDPFDERDRAVMNTLRPYLSHTYRSIQLGDELSAIRRTLNDGGWAAALANGDGEVQHAINGASDAFAALDIDLREGELLPRALLEEFVPGVAGYDPSLPAVPSRGARLSEEAEGVSSNPKPPKRRSRDPSPYNSSGPRPP